MQLDSGAQLLRCSHCRQATDGSGMASACSQTEKFVHDSTSGNSGAPARQAYCSTEHRPQLMPTLMAVMELRRSLHGRSHLASHLGHGMNHLHTYNITEYRATTSPICFRSLQANYFPGAAQKQLDTLEPNYVVHFDRGLSE